jgi:uncharacterized iron-regulated membrane protein
MQSRTVCLKTNRKYFQSFDSMVRLIRRAAWQVHFWLGIILGLYVCVVCLTGSILVYKAEIERANAHGRIAQRTTRSSWQQMYETVRAAYPTAVFTHLEFPRNATDAPYFRILTNTGRLEGRVYVYVNPYDNRIIGHDDGDNGITAFVYDLHVNLLGGHTGRVLNGWGAVAVSMSLLSGLIVWWPGLKNWRFGFRFETRARWKRKNYDLHKLTGIICSAPMLVVTVSGAYLVFTPQFRDFARDFTPPGRWFETPQTSAGRGTPLDLDRLIALAQATIPAGQPRTLQFFQNPTSAWMLRIALPGDWSASGSNFVYIDQYSGRIVKREIHSEQPLAVRLIYDNGPLHFGTFFGQWSRVAWVILGLAGATMFVTSILMYWNRFLSKRIG